MNFDDEVAQGQNLETDDSNLNYPTGGGVSNIKNLSNLKFLLIFFQPFAPNGFLGAAIGVTRAVTQFLGIAFTGAGRILQATLSGGSAASNIDGFGFGNSRL